METLKKEDLKEGEIYSSVRGDDNGRRIFKYKSPNCQYYYLNPYNTNGKEHGYYFINNYDSNIEKEVYPATAEEKHWLNECIKANKFVSKEEAFQTNSDLVLFNPAKQKKSIQVLTPITPILVGNK